DEVGEGVEDGVHLDAALGRRDELALELLTDGVALPDEGLEEDVLLGTADGGEHRLVEVLAVGVDRELGVRDLHRRRRRARELPAGRLAPLAERVHAPDGGGGSELRGGQTEGAPLDRVADAGAQPGPDRAQLHVLQPRAAPRPGCLGSRPSGSLDSNSMSTINAAELTRVAA